MGTLNTYRGGYQLVQDNTTSGTEMLDGETSGKTYAFKDKPSAAMWMGEEFNGVELLFVGGYSSTKNNTPAKALAGEGDTTGVNAGDTFDCMVWGWADNGPAERIAEVSITVGETNRYNDFTTALYANKITESIDYHISNVAQYDADGSSGIAKMTLDTAGLRYLYCEFTAASDAVDIAVFARPY